MKTWHPRSARSGALNLIVALSLLAGLFGASLDGISVANAAGDSSAAQQEASETPTEMPPEITATDTTEPTPPQAAATDTSEPTPTETATGEPTPEPSAEPTAQPSATATATSTALPTATEKAPEPEVRALAELVIPAGAEVVPNSYIVVFKPVFSVASAMRADRAQIEKLGGEITYVYTVVLQGYAAVLTEAALEEARANPLVDYVVADQVLTIIDEENIGAQTIQANPTWGLDRIDQRCAPVSFYHRVLSPCGGELILNNKYKYHSTGSGVHVYVLDTGIRPSHNEFGGRADRVFDAFGPIVDDCHGHGTHVAATIGGTLYGVAKHVNLHAVRVLDCFGSGTESGIIAGVEWVTINHQSPAVANMSLGCNGTGCPLPALDTAINASIASGVVYVVAAGNNNESACKGSPARIPQVLTVGATNSNDARANFSSFGACLDLFAPGVNITSAWIGSNTDTATISGTSMASPHVAGVAALLLQEKPGLAPSQVANKIKKNATKDSVKNAGNNSPNKLLYSRFGVLGFNSPDGLWVADLPPALKKLSTAVKDSA